jgi:hypothetical protein
MMIVGRLSMPTLVEDWAPVAANARESGSTMEQIEVSGDISVQEAGQQVDDDASLTREPQITVGGSISTPDHLPSTGFFDPANPSRAPDITLERVLVARSAPPPARGLKRLWQRIVHVMTEDEREMFELLKPIGYHDRALDQVIVVPANLALFQTDLTSVPRFFTWLIPRTGAHLPAALVHDGLVHRPDEAPTYISDKEIPREESDRIFRDAMGALGTSWLRRWVIWATVLIATLTTRDDKVRWLLTIGVTVAVIVGGGVAATIDLFDCREPLFWMGSHDWWIEILTGAAGAIAVSGLLALTLWWPHNRAGFILGLALSLLLHVTLAVVAVFIVFNFVESAVGRLWARAVVYAVLATAIALPLVFLGLWAC